MNITEWKVILFCLILSFWASLCILVELLYNFRRLAVQIWYNLVQFSITLFKIIAFGKGLFLRNPGLYACLKQMPLRGGPEHRGALSKIPKSNESILKTSGERLFPERYELDCRSEGFLNGIFGPCTWWIRALARLGEFLGRRRRCRRHLTVQVDSQARKLFLEFSNWILTHMRALGILIPGFYTEIWTGSI